MTLRPTWVRLWHVSSRPTPHQRLMRLWLTSRLPQPWWKRGARRPNLRHLRQAGIRAVDLIDLRTATSPPSSRKSTNPVQTWRKIVTCAPTSTRTDMATMLVATSTSAIASVKSGSFDAVWTTIVSTPPGCHPSHHGV
jgi:hypothetical protein